LIAKTYPPKLPEWLSRGGNNFEIVIASEALYVRNISKALFPVKLNEEELKVSRKRIIEKIGPTISDMKFWDIDTITSKDKDYLVERFSAPQEIIRKSKGGGLFLSDDESSFVAINTTDALRFRVISAGDQIEKSYRKARVLEEKFGEQLPFTYSDRYGFLSSRPTECGTGLILRFLAHIPGIVFSNNFVNLRDALLKTGTTIRPLPDEAMSGEGHIFSLNTSRSLGVDEEELLANAKEAASVIVQLESEARDMLIARAKLRVEDKIMRGIGVLSYAKMIAKQEGYALANAIRLGVCEGIFKDEIDLIGATELFIVGQTEHLRKITGGGDPLELDIHRAELFRDYVKTEE
jgi:protein arginine kinase